MTPAAEVFVPPEGSVTFNVSMTEGREPIVGAEISAITSDGIVAIGSTSPEGRLTIDVEELRRLAPHAVIVCHDLFFCGALRTDMPQFYNYREHNVSLAQFVIY